MKLSQLILEAEAKCPKPTQDIQLNLENRRKAIEDQGYGPMNPNLPNDKFWAKKAEMWQLDDVEAKKENKKHEATAVIVASDWHIDETVDPKTVNGINKFNILIL